MSFRRYSIKQNHTNQRDHLFSLKKDKQDKHAEIDLSDIRQTKVQASSWHFKSLIFLRGTLRFIKFCGTAGQT
jgi:hypothetical protein